MWAGCLSVLHTGFVQGFHSIATSDRDQSRKSLKKTIAIAVLTVLSKSGVWVGPVEFSAVSDISARLGGARQRYHNL